MGAHITQACLASLADSSEREQHAVHGFGGVLGWSAPMQALFSRLGLVAAADVSVLIEGETGTGKELVAHAIHVASGRVGPYVVVDCGALMADSADVELFGRETGEGFGGLEPLRGAFEQANGGSIFLDRITDLPRELQSKLRRVVEKGQVRRVGSERAIPVDVRCIAATSGNLKTEVAAGAFREDLYFQIAVAQVHVPPLRDRLDDLPLLVDHFLRKATPPRTLDALPATIWDGLTRHSWPGNVRELRHVVERLLVRPDSAPEWLQTMPADSAALAAVHRPLRSARRAAEDEFERSYLQRLLDQSKGHLAHAAVIADVSQRVLRRLIRKHGLDAALALDSSA